MDNPFRQIPREAGQSTIGRQAYKVFKARGGYFDRASASYQTGMLSLAEEAMEAGLYALMGKTIEQVARSMGDWVWIAHSLAEMQASVDDL